MSLNVLVIPEDFRKDQYVLKPMIEKMIAALGRRARVQVCRDPLLGGVDEALKWERLEAIVDRYRGMTQLFLLIVDRDGRVGRADQLQRIEGLAADFLGQQPVVFLAENAWQEIEVWVLAGMKDLPKGWSWAAIRADLDPKERYFTPYAASRGLAQAPYEGRDVLSREAASNYARVRKLCPDDVGRLEDRLRTALGA